MQVQSNVLGGLYSSGRPFQQLPGVTGQLSGLATCTTTPRRARARKYLGRCATAASKPSVGRLRLSVSLSAGPFRIWSCAAAMPTTRELVALGAVAAVSVATVWLARWRQSRGSGGRNRVVESDSSSLTGIRKKCREIWGKDWYEVAEDVKEARKLVAAAALGGTLADTATCALANGEEPMPLLPITSERTVALCAALPLREGDVFVASFPKSGTTWMQHIVHTLATDGQSPLAHVSDACPFFEADRTWSADGSLAAIVQANHAQISRRMFNTHLRWSMMPKSHPGARYVYMTRRAADACVSFYHHLAHQAAEDGGFDGTLDDFVVEWSAGRAPFGSWSAHLKSWLCGPGEITYDCI